MTIEQLIAELKKHPPTTIVRLGNDSHSIVQEVEHGECYGCGRDEVTIR